MQTKPNAMLFDLDGTLLETAKDLGNALNHVLLTKERPLVTYEQYRNIASDGAKGMLELGFGEELEFLDFEDLRQQFLTHYENNICVDTIFFEGIETLLNELNQQSIPWGIVTNKPEFLTQKLIQSFPLLQACKVVISGDSLPERKPHPKPLLYAQEQLEIQSPNTWYIGDAQRDIEAANAANMTSVVAEYGYLPSIQESHNWSADIHIRQPLDLLAFL
ncbi:HAD family hydrolase [Paraglaciecola marina]|uniref:HAD family hydrolase n=1 Tax=Paraglaciecola marina TaxID=2500157 RepID=UPI0010617627|nr:HAD-IA family hydrolase [Paraglaciecola marina]